jgi:hypothetical protein
VALFSQYRIFDVQDGQKRQLRKTIQSLEANYLLNSSEEDLANSLVAELALDIPEINESAIYVEHEERQIDVSRDPMRLFIDRDEPFYISGTALTFVVPFTGDPQVFEIQPQNFAWSSGESRVSVAGNDLRFTFMGANVNGAAAKNGFNQELQLLKQNLQSLSRSAESQTAELRQLARQLISERRNKLLEDAQMAANLGFPIKKRDGAASTHAVPVQRRQPRIERPPAADEKFKPEPSLAMEEYENILAIMRNMVTVMEQSPKAFENMGEEDLRTQFLVQLNAQYEGRATGETFNYQGKTDILIRADEGGNVFIAECKFWGGEKQFLETIDQLLSYLTWRDNKAAVLVFNRNVNFTEVLQKVSETAPKHSCYKRTLKANDTAFRYVFHNPGDVNREVLLTVMVFNVPTDRTKKTS